MYPVATSRYPHQKVKVSSGHVQLNFSFVKHKSLHQWCLNLPGQFKVLTIHIICHVFNDQNLFVFTILMRFLFNEPRENVASSGLLYSLIPRAKR